MANMPKMTLKIVTLIWTYRYLSIDGISIPQLKSPSISLTSQRVMVVKCCRLKACWGSLRRRITLVSSKGSKKIKICRWLRLLLKGQRKYQINLLISLIRCLVTVFRLLLSRSRLKRSNKKKNIWGRVKRIMKKLKKSSLLIPKSIALWSVKKKRVRMLLLKNSLKDQLSNLRKKLPHKKVWTVC